MVDKQPKTRREFIKLARSSEQVESIEEGGRHTIIRFKNGTHVAIHRHAGDIPKGTQYAIIFQSSWRTFAYPISLMA